MKKKKVVNLCLYIGFCDIIYFVEFIEKKIKNVLMYYCFVNNLLESKLFWDLEKSRGWESEW
jgi:hypothetical protein